MTRLNFLLIICLSPGLFFSLTQQASSEIVPGVLTFHEANQTIDYNWYTYVPNNLDKEVLNYILLSCNVSKLTFDYNELTEDVRQLAEYSIPDSEKYGYILLRPVIPRKIGGLISGAYTAAFDRNSFLESTDPFYRRCDERINLMIDHLIDMLRVSGYNVFNKVFVKHRSSQIGKPS